MQASPEQVDRGDSAARTLQAPQPIPGAGNWSLHIADNRLVWSDEIYKIFGVGQDSFPSTVKAFYSFIHPEDRQRLYVAQRLLRGEEKMDAEYRIVLPDGSQHHVHTRAVLIVDNDGKPSLLSGPVNDITARKKSEHEVQRLSNHLRTILGSITDAFVTLDRQWRFTYMNSESEMLLYRRRDEMLGRVLGEELPDLCSSIFEREVRAAVNENRSVEFEALSESADRCYSIRAYPSEDELTVYFHDITEHKKIERDPESNAERFRTVARVTADAIWDWRLASNHIWWNDGIKKLFDLDGYEGEGTVEGKAWVAHRHPDEPAAIVDSIQRAIDGDALEWRAEYLPRDGSFADVVDHVVVICDADGRAVRMVGGMNDITKRKRTLVAMMSVAASATMEFFRQLTLTMADALGAQAAYVGRALPDWSLTMCAIAATPNGALLDNFDYSMEGPCRAMLLRDHELEINDDFALVHPKSALLDLLDVKAFAGRLLLNSVGEVIRLLFVAFSKPIRQSDFMLLTTRIFAARGG